MKKKYLLLLAEAFLLAACIDQVMISGKSISAVTRYSFE